MWEAGQKERELVGRLAKEEERKQKGKKTNVRMKPYLGGAQPIDEKKEEKKEAAPVRRSRRSSVKPDDQPAPPPTPSRRRKPAGDEAPPRPGK